MHLPQTQNSQPKWGEVGLWVLMGVMGVLMPYLYSSVTGMRGYGHYFSSYDEGRAWLIIQDLAAWLVGREGVTSTTGGRPELFHHGAPLFYLLWVPVSSLSPMTLARLCHGLSLAAVGWAMAAATRTGPRALNSWLFDRLLLLVIWICLSGFAPEAEVALGRFTIEGLGYAPLAVAVLLWARGRFGWAGVAVGCALAINYKLMLWAAPALVGLAAAGRLRGFGWRALGQFVTGALGVGGVLSLMGVVLGWPLYQYLATWVGLALRDANPGTGSNASDRAFYPSLLLLTGTVWLLLYLLVASVGAIIIRWRGALVSPSLRGWTAALLVWVVILLVLPKAPRMMIPLIITLSLWMVVALRGVRPLYLVAVLVGVIFPVFHLNLESPSVRPGDRIPDEVLDTQLTWGKAGHEMALYRMPQVYPLAYQRDPAAYAAWVAKSPPRVLAACPPDPGNPVTQAYLWHPYLALTGCPVEPAIETYTRGEGPLGPIHHSPDSQKRYMALTPGLHRTSFLLWAEGAEFTGWSWAELLDRYKRYGRGPILLVEADTARP